MVGHVLTRQLREMLGEGSTSSWINVQLSYDLIYEAVLEFVDRTACMQTIGNLTTSANNSTYTLPYDFLRLYMKDDNGDYFIQYVDGNNSISDFIYDEYEDIIMADQTTAVQIPSVFSIIPGTARTQITGNTTSAGAVSSTTNLSNLVNSSETFASTVSPGDDVFNITNSYSGKVLSANNTTVSTACYSSSGTSVGWASGDNYLIQPQPRLTLIVDPPTSTANETLRMYYVQKPAPVYSPYKAYNIDPQYMSPIVKYAAFVYKYRDMEPNFGDKWYVAFDTTCKQVKQRYDSSVRKKGWTINLKRPQYGR